MNNPQRKKAEKILFKNCRIYLKDEIRILNPDILITQGNEAKQAINASLDVVIKTYDEFSSIIRLNGDEVFWLHTYHPNNWGAFNRLRNFNKESEVAEGWVFYANRISRFIKKKMPQ
jgi:uracil-DNA glycosylase